MNKLELTLTLKAPLAVGRQKPGGSMSEVERYVPGTVLRGTIAGQLLRQSHQANSDEDPGGDFTKLFTADEAVIFTHAYPTLPQQDSWTDNPQKVERCGVLPATAVSSKAKPGFKTKPDDPENLGVFDTLIDRFCTERLGLVYDPVDRKNDRVEQFLGFYGVKSHQTYESVSLETRLLTRVGINRRRATAEDEILYSIEVLNEVQLAKNDEKPNQNAKKQLNPTVLKSQVYSNNEKLLKNLQEYLSDLKVLYLGGSRSRGLGKVCLKVELANQGSKDLTNSLQARHRDFNKALVKRYGEWADAFGLKVKDKDALDPDRTFFSLDLQSDAILWDPWRRTTVISEAMLVEMLGIEGMLDHDVQLCGVYTSHDYRSGWNAAWGLMKDVDLVTNSGSVFFFSVPQEGFDDRWLPALERLEWLGVGERTTEGFGQVQVCSPFHTIFQENAV
ncbi:type III-D CRISPR-associated RAMP protein Csx10 [Prochlorothrix hollandica]|uniref:CRISPR type III-associated protein domain-containing protein n=1 Tax=Prochlorothrix hollandica PCC 9006 = CALU 1027 TaxID=317619 RepID=A0A0M2PUV6_PROHO|nr:CRISPR-associated RAMP protein Csx10 [Prochlorothrix hollandica]KKI99899.1 hypothetical protein PROH_08820 [Prochlorothrix hollandica PCC 9006 = CALU 1027]